jgi:GT2 family glycosyltransferase
VGDARTPAPGENGTTSAAAARRQARPRRTAAPPATVTVVVATRNRARLLDRCLTALAAQSRRPDAVVLVDDASTDPGTDAAIAAHRDALQPQVLHRDTPGGPGRARQLGWQAATTDYVAFTDDDCRPDPAWLAALMAAAAPQHIVVGRTQPDPADGPPRTVFDRTMRISAHDGRFSTCNVLYPRALLEAVGGFDLEIDQYGEDTDLGQRALASGATGVWAPDALVWHAVHPGSLATALRERRRVGEIARLVRRHPSLRREIWEGPFWKPEHRELLLAVAGLAAMPLTKASLLAGLPWVEHVPARLRHLVPDADRRGLGWKLSQAAALAAIDAVEVASCVAGSIRHRTLFV